jgi:hypothetical protein
MKTHKIFTLALLLSLILSACAAADPAVVDVSRGAQIGAQMTLDGMRSVYQGQPGSVVMQMRDMYLLAWPKGVNYGFTVVCTGQCPDFNSLKINTVSLGEMIKSLESYGWKYISPAALPQTIKATLEMTRAEAALSAISKFGAPLLMVPVVPSSIEPPKPDVVIQ